MAISQIGVGFYTTPIFSQYHQSGIIAIKVEKLCGFRFVQGGSQVVTTIELT